MMYLGEQSQDWIKRYLKTGYDWSVFEIDIEACFKGDMWFEENPVCESEEVIAELPHGLSTAPEILQIAFDTISQRGKERDKEDGERSMLATVNAFNALTGHNLTETDGWKFMTVLKLARSGAGGYKLDDYIDMSAYAALAGECENNKHCKR